MTELTLTPLLVLLCVGFKDNGQEDFRIPLHTFIQSFTGKRNTHYEHGKAKKANSLYYFLIV